MNVRSVEWRTTNDTKYHLFIGLKSICGRQYSNGAYEATDSPRKDDRCLRCVKALPSLIGRLETLRSL